jgi:hypothetical protein
MLSQLRLGVITAITFLSGGVFAQEPATDPGDLPDFFAGVWTIAGSEKTFRESCQWLSYNSFLVCEGEDKSTDAPEKWIKMIGYSHAEDAYNLTVFSGDGGKMTMDGWLDGEVWKFTGENHIFHTDIGMLVLRRQETMKPTKDGYWLKVEVSKNAGPWQVVIDEEIIRAK